MDFDDKKLDFVKIKLVVHYAPPGENRGQDGPLRFLEILLLRRSIGTIINVITVVVCDIKMIE